jgi:hypothetical protein
MDNINVTLADAAEPPRRQFPCPLCGTQLDLRQSRTRKPYCVCNACGVQIFFRGKNGISRLRELLETHDRLLGDSAAIATPAIAVFNRLEQLRAHKSELQQRRPLLFADDDLEHTIAAVDLDISRLQTALAQMSSGENKS